MRTRALGTTPLLLVLSMLLCSVIASAQIGTFEQVLGLRGLAVVLVGEVEPGWTAGRADVRRGDLIVAFNGRRVGEFSDYKAFLDGLRVAALQDRAVLDLLHYEATSGVYVPQTATLSLRPQDPSNPSQTYLGIRCTFTYFVQEVLDGGPAKRLGLTPGDFIEDINGKDPRSVLEMETLVSVIAASPSRQITLWVTRWRALDGGKMRGENTRMVSGTL